MKVLLVDPHWKNVSSTCGPNTGLGYISSILNNMGIKVEIVDFLGDEDKIKSMNDFKKLEDNFITQITKKIESEDYSLVGITCSMGAYARTLKIAHKCKEVKKDLITVVGGPHPTLMDMTSIWKDQIFKDSNDIDIVVRGEGEKTIQEVINSLETNDFTNIKGITFKENGDIIPNFDRPLVENLDDLPFPAWQLFPLNKYPGILYVVASRGCMYDCAFCDDSLYWRKAMRWRMPSNVIDELIVNIEEHGVNNFRFIDASFTSHPKLMDICKMIKHNKLEIKWNSFARVNEINENMLRLMKDAGCVLLEIGIESGNQDILDKMRKGFTIDQTKRAIQLCKKVGIAVRGSFIIGFPGETENTAYQTIEFAKSLDLEAYSWHILMPSIEMLTSSKEWKIFIEDINWKNFDADIPDKLLLGALRQSEDLSFEPHTPTRLAHQGLPISTEYIKLFRYGNLSLTKMSELVSKAVDETKKPRKEYDYFRL